MSIVTMHNSTEYWINGKNFKIKTLTAIIIQRWENSLWSIVKDAEFEENICRQKKVK